MAGKSFRIVPPPMVRMPPARRTDFGSRFTVPAVLVPRLGPLPRIGSPTNTAEVFGLPKRRP